jgi:hypothetical protein
MGISYLQMLHNILYKGLQYPKVFVSKGILEQIPHGYGGTIVHLLKGERDPEEGH